ERSFKQAEVDRVQACRRQARVDDADSGSAGNSDLSAEEEEDDTYKTRQQTLSFFDERYEYAACSFPAQHEQFRAEASHILRVHNEKLLRSFCCFATQYIAASCPKDADDFTELRETAKTLPDQDLLEAGMQNSFFPHMDSFRRDRSFYMYRVYKKLRGKELELSEPKLNLWFFLDCVFRYLGNHSFFTDVLLHPEWFVADRSIYAEGLTTETRSRVVGAVEDAFRLAAGSRRSVRSMFANLDGRRRTFGKFMDVVRVGADTRFVDHAVTALKLWAESALGAGRLILQTHHFLTADLLGQTSSVLAQLQTLLLSVHLLGRPGCKTASDMRGYRLKFMLNDLYVFMACATCANRQEHPLWRPSAECKCRACSRLWHLRTTFMFWGPSPLCLARAMSGDADNCREALDAAPARWTAFRTALQKHFKDQFVQLQDSRKLWFLLKVRWFPGIARNQV
ncbi:unnamed protein product, partial [Effrenium voratum]